MKFYKIGTILLAIVLLASFTVVSLRAEVISEGTLKKVEYLPDGKTVILTVRNNLLNFEIWEVNKVEYTLPSEWRLDKRIFKKRGGPHRNAKSWTIEQNPD